MKSVAIIGAGPAGNYTAYLLAKANYNVTIYEEHLEPGLPIQCTGILTNDLKNHVELSDEYIVNRMRKVKVFAPDGTVFETKNDDIIVCRHKFDNYILKKAIVAGATIEKGTKFISYNDETQEIIVKNKEAEKKVKIDILIGADGPNSKVSKIINEEMLKRHPTPMYYGSQATVKGTFEPNTYHVYLGNICPEFFLWVVPEDTQHARIGLATKETPNIYFKHAMEKLGYTDLDITDRQGGLIPCYNPNINVQKNNIYLIGDAATIIKSTTGGGIIPHLEAAKILTDCVINNKDFNKELKREKLWLHLFLRKFLDQFSDEEYNQLVKMLNNSSANEVMEKYTRDNLLQLIFHLVRENPQFIFFGMKHMKKMWKAL
ncbi:NAD(P)/FAD-dependent oxidoreductase [Candidatus Woesearchaeota archaeon]|nr:NAD(P)/FAD-dependent oxidoreductase [Candidatus Woesearchaeota archaeon]